MSLKPSTALVVADSRTRIFDAARELFGEHGAGGVTMAEVAEAAGVPRFTVFNQFGSKHVLVEAITEGVFAGYEAIFDNALADRKTPAAVLVEALNEALA